MKKDGVNRAKELTLKCESGSFPAFPPKA